MEMDAQMNLKAQGLEHTIKEVTTQQGDATTTAASVKIATVQENAKALVLLRHDLHESLKSEYLLVEDPKELWDSPNERYGNHKNVLLPKAHYDWTNLRFQDFKTVSDYNSTLFRIVSLLRYCDHPITEEQMINKTLSTFHASNIILTEQYRFRAFKKYSELISVLLVAEQNNDLLLKNHNLKPTGSSATHEINAIESSNPPEANAIHSGGRGNYNGRGRGRGNYRGRGRGRGRGRFSPRNNNFKHSDKNWGQSSGNQRQTSYKGNDTCHRCGMTGHWGRTCHMNSSEVGTKEQCLLDSGTTHTILKNKEYFSKLTIFQANVSTIFGTAKLIEGSGKACIIFPNGTKLIINDALYSSKSRRNLISFKDVRQNGYHLETMTVNKEEFICLTAEKYGKKYIYEKLPAISSGLYRIDIRPIEINMISNQKLDNRKSFTLWHDRLGHPGTRMMHRIIENSNGHSIKNVKIPRSNELTCSACSLGKMIIRTSINKIATESPMFLERIQGDICGPIHPACGPFRYFMTLIDASTRWSHVSLLSSRNVAFAKLLAQIIRLRTQFPDHTIKKIGKFPQFFTPSSHPPPLMNLQTFSLLPPSSHHPPNFSKFSQNFLSLLPPFYLSIFRYPKQPHSPPDCLPTGEHHSYNFCILVKQ
uniref:CCHC-type domain-containing protein n=1 Tax=Beta vulgaris TaxID=161934 RepID=E2DMZ1_BETVU|nr:hypothetical protein [Beta vulgaris]